MLSVSLKSLRIHAAHGLYPEEAIQGNDFEIDIELRLPAEIDDAWPLIDYARVYALTQEVMMGPRVTLLEMLVQAIWQRLHREWPQLSFIRVCVRKLHPPLGGEVAASQVCFEKEIPAQGTPL
ncbi:MAG: dihydroneopterin aldolase [Bacteroidetes bacterium]|nr:dihydroneopterin aldolase [Bacteroidota bacterium]